MDLKRLLIRYKEELLDLIYPKICFNCGQRISIDYEGYVCADCLKTIRKIDPPFCVSCGRSVSYGIANSKCAECLGQSYYFSKGFTVCLYEGLIKECIHSFKYNSCEYLGSTLCSLMADFAVKYIDIKKIDVITAVPLHWLRLRDRGFNQSAVLAKGLSRRTGILFSDKGLLRIKSAQPQVDLPRQKRFNNVKNIFKVKDKNLFNGKTVLIIDDVFTTGATLNECSKIVMESGAKDVWVFSLARGH